MALTGVSQTNVNEGLTKILNINKNTYSLTKWIMHVMAVN